MLVFYWYSLPSGSSSVPTTPVQPVSHPGVPASWRLISAKFVWPGLSSKIQTHIHSTVPAFPVPTQRFSHIHIDIVGPLPSSQGFSYLLTTIDRTTCWPEVVPLTSISAKSCVRAFLSTWVSRFGVPAILNSDRGTQFTSSVWTTVFLLLGSQPPQND